MKLDDVQLGRPNTLYKDTKANLEALAGVVQGSISYATDTSEIGVYDGAAWDWVSVEAIAAANVTYDPSSTYFMPPATDNVQTAFEEASLSWVENGNSHDHNGAGVGGGGAIEHEALSNPNADSSYRHITDVEYEDLTDGGETSLHTHPAAAGADSTAIHDDVTGEIAALTEKTTPVSADLFLIEDSGASNAKKKVQLGILFITLGREKLTAARTYYVRTDGNDSNTGLVNNSGGAFLTVQKAVDVISGLDINGQIVTAQLGDGTYTGAVTLKNVVGFAAPGNLVIQGNSVTPTNVIISTTSASCFSANSLSAVWDIKNMQLKTTTSGNCLNVSNGAKLRYTGIDFGACAGNHIHAADGAGISCTGNYTISGGAGNHFYCQASSIGVGGVTITFNANAAWSTACANAFLPGNLICLATINLNSKTVTGTKYAATMNATIFVAGAGTSYFPGTAGTGSTATGGQYQ